MYKQISSYELTTGTIHFLDGSSRKFTNEAIVMIDKMLYMLTNNSANFISLSLTTIDDIDMAIDLIQE